MSSHLPLVKNKIGKRPQKILMLQCGLLLSHSKFHWLLLQNRMSQSLAESDHTSDVLKWWGLKAALIGQIQTLHKQTVLESNCILKGLLNGLEFFFKFCTADWWCTAWVFPSKLRWEWMKFRSTINLKPKSITALTVCKISNGYSTNGIAMT